MTDPAQLPPFAVILRLKVADFDVWKAAFDANEDARRAGGIVAHHINRAVDDPNDVSVFLAVTDIEAAKAFTSSAELKAAMANAGVQGPPELLWVTPVREDVTWDRELPAMLITHTVADFDKWLAGYDAAAELQSSSGIIGQAANRSIDDPSLAVIYHQAENAETLRSFLANPGLKSAMEAAGVTSEPEVTFHTGGWGKSYN